MKKRVDIGYHDYVYKLFFEPGLDLAPNESLTRNITFQVTDDCCMNCSYCLTGDTQILMSDFTTKPIKDIRVGDKVMAFPEYGDIKNLHSRDYLCETTVLNTFQRKAPTIAMDIDGNRRLNITKEHKILARRNKSDHSYDYREAGRFKVGQNVYCVPSYEDIDYLSPTFDSDYKIGYIVGMFKGDGSIRRYSYPESGRPQYMYKIRLAVKDAEIINRTKEYLSDLGIDYYTKDFEVSKKYSLKTEAIFANTQKTYNDLNNLYECHFRKNRSASYFQGFLAGIYDAEGSLSNGKGYAVRITNTDQEIIDEIVDALDAIGVSYRISDNGATKNKAHR